MNNCLNYSHNKMAHPTCLRLVVRVGLCSVTNGVQRRGEQTRLRKTTWSGCKMALFNQKFKWTHMCADLPIAHLYIIRLKTFGGSGPALTAHGSLDLKQKIQIQTQGSKKLNYLSTYRLFGVPDLSARVHASSHHLVAFVSQEYIGREPILWTSWTNNTIIWTTCITKNMSIFFLKNVDLWRANRWNIWDFKK
jgi:hypothetical protein